MTGTNDAGRVHGAAWQERLASSDAIGGVVGPGRWLVLEYLPVTLFSLKSSLATSSVGKTLVVPTPYAIKMALVDAAFRAGLRDHECDAFLRALVPVAVRIGAPERCVVTHTFVKVRQEPHGGSRPELPYVSSIAYRELVYHHGAWRWAFDLALANEEIAERIIQLAPYVSYIGKRGSFIQFLGITRRETLDARFTQLPDQSEEWELPERAHVVPLDDFGPEASLDTLGTFVKATVRRDRHRRFVPTVIPLGIVNEGPAFTEYGMKGRGGESENRN